jgi:Flp pilus assembly protein TadG
MGRGYIEKARLGRAVDAGALAAARSLRRGEDVARTEAETVARANHVAVGIGDITTQLSFGNNERGESTVLFGASRTIPTTFMTVLGIANMSVSASATSAVPPVDIVLVLDTSGSLALAGAWGALQDAARDFVHKFDDTIDQLGLVSFQIAAHDRFSLAHNFSVAASDAITAMGSAGDTNIGEGLRKARLQLTGPGARLNAAKVVVLFTDGRATGFRGNLGSPAQDRMLAAYANGTRLRGYFDDPEDLAPFTAATPDGCNDAPSCWGLNHLAVRARAADVGASEAEALRLEDITIYTIALGNPSAADPLLTPDLDYLRHLANEDGIESHTQPKGKSYFAPSAAQLLAIFNLVARDLIVRLAA